MPLISVGSNGVTTNYGYDLRGRLTSVTTNPGASQAVYGLTYDNAGNLTVVAMPDGSSLTYGYDNAHRMTSVTDNLGESVTYTLDALGDHTATVLKSSGGTIAKQQTASFDELGRMLSSIGAASQTTSYTYDKDDNQVTVTDPRSKLEYIWLDDLPVAMVIVATNTIYYIHTDQIGTSQKITDSAAEVGIELILLRLLGAGVALAL